MIMELNIQVKEVSKKEPIDTTLPIPVTRSTRNRIDKIKQEKVADINGMLRDAVDQIIKHVESTISNKV